MTKWKNEAEAREQIKSLVAEYYNDFKNRSRTSPFIRETDFPMQAGCMMRRKCVHL